MAKRFKSGLSAILAFIILSACFAFPAGAADAAAVKDVNGTEAEAFSFLLSGDPQIGAGGLENDRTGWLGSLSNALAVFDDAAFLITAGDQINNAGNNEQLEVFLEGVELSGLPLAPTPGNHDPDILDNFDLPNLDSHGNYWYTYGDALFLHLNSNYKFGAIIKTTIFIRKAVAANPDAEWKIAVFHHTFYSAVESRSKSAETFIRRLFYGTLFECNGIDLALAGHDHCYVRTKPMKLFKPNDGGITYITANSGSGSKYYDIAETYYPYSESQLQVKAPTLTKVDVASGELTLTTYRTDTMDALDACVISK
ncbi:MAG: metallophosphoesterase [Oscillospiraceae bacterium]|nr:metallophosphoesterase [Oscillospiraceae bacterium]